MGGVCSACKELWDPEELDLKPNDIVGSTAPASLKSMRLEDIPPERHSMAALEMESMTKTLYYRKRRQFPRENSLVFEDVSSRTLRGMLAEPVGRFYLSEYARAKNLRVFETRIAFLSLYYKLKEELAPGVKLEKEEPGKETEGERQARLDQWCFDLAKTFLSPDGDRYLLWMWGADSDRFAKVVASVFSACEPNLAVIEAAIFAGNGALLPAPVAPVEERLRAKRKILELIEPVQHTVFRAVVSSGDVEEFKEHSEYKRYKSKFTQVYNNMNHEDFDFMATLGKGSFGRVIRVRKRTTQKQYAMKIMSKKKILSGAENAAQVTIERNVLVMCNSPSVVKVNFAFHTTRALFLCLDLLDGGTLSHAMHVCGGAMPIEAVRFHTAQMTLGLEHLHKHGILFRDLKPLNVMLDRKGNAVLTDMGLACKFRPSQYPDEEEPISTTKSTRSNLPAEEEEGGLERAVSSLGGGAPGQPLKATSMRAAAGMETPSRQTGNTWIPILPKEKLKCVGTYGFRAPELLATETERNGYGAPVDYWALGVTVCFLLTNKMPFKARQQPLLQAQEKPKETERRLQKSPPRLPPDLPADALDLIRGLLHQDPALRYGDADLVHFHNHPFFQGIDWEKLDRREIPSPYRPSVPVHPPDEQPHFDSVHSAMAQFTHENVLEMFGGENEIKEEYTHVPRAEQRLFRTWDYIPDSALELEWEIAEKTQANQVLRRRRTVLGKPAVKADGGTARSAPAKGGALLPDKPQNTSAAPERARPKSFEAAAEV